MLQNGGRASGDLPRSGKRRWYQLLLLILVSGCRDWRQHVDPRRAAGEPEQVLVRGEPAIEFKAQHRHVRLLPRATYTITGYAAETSRKLLDQDLHPGTMTSVSAP